MNWYKKATEEEEEFKTPSEVEGVYHLNNISVPDEFEILGLRGQAQKEFIERMSGTKNWLIRWNDGGKMRANNVLSADREDAIRIFKENTGREIIDIIPVSVGMGRIAESKNHGNGSLNDYELKQLAYLGITPEQIERSKSMTNRPYASWKAYIEQHFGLQKSSKM